MLKQTIILAAIVGLVLVLVGEAPAQVSESDIGISNPYVPEDLRYEGAQFRLVFPTDGNYQALSTSIDWYNTQVTAEADANTDLNGLGSWYVIGSTSTVSAKANTYTGTSDPTVPIHTLSGSKVSDNNPFWAAGVNYFILNPIGDTPQGAVRTTQVHSGTRVTGLTSSWPLGGALDGTTLRTNWGDPTTTYVNWIHKSGGWPASWGANPSENEQGLYGMSGVLTVISEGTTLPGDANDNGFVDDTDLAILLGNWEQDAGLVSTAWSGAVGCGAQRSNHVAPRSDESVAPPGQARRGRKHLAAAGSDESVAPPGQARRGRTPRCHAQPVVRAPPPTASPNGA